MSAGVVHIAGHEVQVGEFLRQRCAWCGAVLEDYDLSRLMYTVDTPPEQRRPATWPVGGLIEVDGGVTWVVDHDDGKTLPANACAVLDVEVTR